MLINIIVNYNIFIPNSIYYPVFFFNNTATTEIYTLSLHDALPISAEVATNMPRNMNVIACRYTESTNTGWPRSEEHTSELQSQFHLVCRLLLEKKKKKKTSARYSRDDQLRRR